MSKKFNYTKQFNKNNEELTKPMQEQEEKEIAQKPVEFEQPKDADDEPVVVYGVVSNCKKLNVRESNTKESDVVAVITEGTKVTILEELGNDEIDDICDWFKITTANGKINGYCMAEFITIK